MHSDLVVSEVTMSTAVPFNVSVSAVVKNTGAIPGSDVVQAYISLPSGKITHPSLQLRAFTKVHNLAPDATERVTLQLDKYAVSYWDTPAARWKADEGTYQVFVGSSSASLPLSGTFVLEKGFEWSGL